MFLRILIVPLLLWTFVSVAQPANDITAKIDSLFLPWNSPNQPGGSVGVVKNGKLVYQKSFGLASLEHLIPNQNSTLYNVASVSKQFSAFGILLLEREGKLSVDDDIRKYLTELPDFGHTVTIRHMLHHTSGLRSLHTLLQMAGWREDDSRTNEDLMRFMVRQKDLNFVPGDEYYYCNTGFIFMAEIIERITGEEFVPWMKSNVFEPLGMHHTYVEEQYNRVVPGNADSYDHSRDGNFDRATEYWGYVGSGNIHTTTSDLLIWLSYFHEPSSYSNLFERMQTTDPLNDGSPLDYAFGVTVNSYKGSKKVGHGGSIGGFRANIASFTEEKLDIVVLTNFSTSNPGGKLNQIADIVLNKSNDKNNRSNSGNSTPINLKKPATYVVNEDPWRVFRLFESNGKWHFQLTDGPEGTLERFEKGIYYAGNDQIELKGKVFTLSTSDGKRFSGTEIKSPSSGIDIQEYVGEYYSPELMTSYYVNNKDGKMTIFHPRHGQENVEIITPDHLQADINAVRYLHVIRDGSGKITGLKITNGRARNVWFEKR